MNHCESAETEVTESMADDAGAQTARQYLSAELARLRRLSGLGGRDIAAHVGISQSKVSRIETGAGLPTLPEVRAWVAAVGASDETRDYLVQLTEAAHTDVETWRMALRGRPHLQDQTGAYETTARTIRNFHPAIVPGLLQTAEYVRRVLSFVDVDPFGMQHHDHAAAVAARMQRQEALYDENRQFDFLITEAALRWHSYDSALVIPQLDRIASVATLRNVRIGLLPADAPVPGILEHNFQLYTDRDDDQEPVVRVELIHARLTISDPEDVAIYQERFTRWSDVAVHDDQAQELLHRIADDIRSRE